MTQSSTLSGPQGSIAELAKRKPRLVLYGPDGPARVVALEPRNELGRGPSAGRTIDDPRLSRSHAELVRNRSVGTYKLRDLGSKNGTWVNGERITQRVLVDNDVIRLGNTIAIFEERVAPEYLADTTRSGSTIHMEQAATQAAMNNRPVLLVGPSGSGKTWLAERIAAGSEAARPYVHVNCGALQPSLVDSELFGHAAGAFTGAAGCRAGLIESAHNGTLFLDEIGTIALDLQARLLTCIENGRIRRVGENNERTVKVRFIAATNADVEQAVVGGTFREDLLYRAPLALPRRRARLHSTRATQRMRRHRAARRHTGHPVWHVRRRRRALRRRKHHRLLRWRALGTQRMWRLRDAPCRRGTLRRRARRAVRCL